MKGHSKRVSVQSWSRHLLSSGSRDNSILQRDFRAPEDFQRKLMGHKSEVRAVSSSRARCTYTAAASCVRAIATAKFQGGCMQHMHDMH